MEGGGPPMGPVWVPLIAVVLAVITGLTSWALAKRKGSGTVKNSEALELWNANQEFRNMLLEEARARSAENAALRAEAAKCHEEQAELGKRVASLERELAQRTAGGT